MTQQASTMVTIREYQPKDLDQLIRIDRSIWWEGADRRNPAVGGHGARQAGQNATQSIWPDVVSRLDVLHCLGKSTDVLVAVAPGDGGAGEDGGTAEDGERVLGAMLMSVGSRPVRWHEQCETMARDVRREAVRHDGGADLLDAMERDGEAIDALSARAASGYPAEVVLFMLDAAARGLGLGRRLFDQGLETMRGAGADRYFLYTDTTCTYTFYEHRGLRRIGEQLGATDMLGATLDRFIYAGATDAARADMVNATDAVDTTDLTDLTDMTDASASANAVPPASPSAGTSGERA